MNDFALQEKCKNFVSPAGYSPCTMTKSRKNNHLSHWNPEEHGFWEKEGKYIAARNLWISVPCLASAFAVWMFWSVITVQMQNLGFPFEKGEFYTLSAIAGLSGATLRIPNSFFIALSGGRYVVAITTTLLLLPSVGVGIALQNPNTSFWTFAMLAALSGFGGGAFASSMSNISLFFPKRMQGLALGLNAGLGNLGVSLMQILLPLATTVSLFGALGGEGRRLPEAIGGSIVWIQNCGLVWIPILVALSIASWILMHNLPMHVVGSALSAIGKVIWLLFLGLLATAVGVFLLLKIAWSMWVVLPITIIVTLILMRFLTPSQVRKNLSQQFVIFREKHNWVMTWLYVMTFGSFIGYSSAFPKLIQDVFGYLPDGSINPNAPNPLYYAWLGPLVGSIARPIGGWISDKFGGAKVTHWDTIAMIIFASGAAILIKKAGGAENPQTYFIPFLLLFLLLFVTTGIGNGSTFRMIPIIFKSNMAGPVLGWTSAIAAYGAFIIPKVMGAQIEKGTPEYALYGFILYYLSCLMVNWWYYARKNAEIKC